MNAKTNELRLIGKLLSPSWLSGFIVILVGLILSVGTTLVFSLQSSGFEKSLLLLEQPQKAPALTTPAQVLPTDSSEPTLENSWPLMLIWGGVGLLAYSIMATVAHSVSEARELRQSLNYVNARPENIIETTLERVASRAFAFILLIVLIDIFIKRIIPFCVTASLRSAHDLSFNSGLYVLLAFAVSAFCMHLMVVFFRLTMAKVRVLHT